MKIVAGERGRVDPAVLLGQGLAVEELIDGRRTLHDGAGEHDHDDFELFVVELPAVARPEELAERVAAAAEAADVLRVKGFAEVAERPMRLVVQAVGPRVSHHFDRPWGGGRGAGDAAGGDRAEGARPGGGGADSGGLMHILNVTTASLDDLVEPVDLRQEPAAVVALSFSDSDLAGMAAAWRPGAPEMRLAALRDLGTRCRSISG